MRDLRLRFCVFDPTRTNKDGRPVERTGGVDAQKSLGTGLYCSIADSLTTPNLPNLAQCILGEIGICQMSYRPTRMHTRMANRPGKPKV